MQPDTSELFASENWYSPSGGARYLQLAQYILDAIDDGRLKRGRQLPAERDIARMGGVSRVTVRKTMSHLAERGALEQRQGAGTFVRQQDPAPAFDQTLSALTSFTQYLEQLGLKSSSRVLTQGIFPPTPEESLALGLGAGDRVSRIRRLRFADDAPIAIETSSLPLDILDDPSRVVKSLYSVLREKGRAPVRAVQSLTAAEVGRADAELLDLAPGKAVLKIERTGYLASGRPIEWTSGFYRSDVYKFVAELRLAQ